MTYLLLCVCVCMDVYNDTTYILSASTTPCLYVHVNNIVFASGAIFFTKNYRYTVVVHADTLAGSG